MNATIARVPRLMFTVPEVCSLTGIKRDRLLPEMFTFRLSTVAPVGRTRRIRVSDLQAWAAARRQASMPVANELADSSEMTNNRPDGANESVSGAWHADTDCSAIPCVMLSVPEAGVAVSLGKDSIYRLIRSGELPSVLVESSRRIRLDDLQAWAAGLPVAKI